VEINQKAQGSLLRLLKSRLKSYGIEMLSKEACIYKGKTSKLLLNCCIMKQAGIKRQSKMSNMQTGQEDNLSGDTKGC